MKYDIILGGVGGQGILMASQIIAKAAMGKGLKVLVAEVHGMAQRGGSVVSHVRLGDVYAPLIPEGRGDILVGFEYMETFRYLKFLKKGGKILFNTRKIKPAILDQYPDITVDLKDYNVLKIDATDIAKKVGNVLTTNSVMLGALSKFGDLPFSDKEMKETLKANIFPGYVEVNLKAFDEGIKAVR